MSRESGKDCKGVEAQRDKRERNLWLRCNTCKQFCILFVRKLGASGGVAGEVCSFDGVELWEWGVQQYFGLSASVELQISKPESYVRSQNCTEQRATASDPTCRESLPPTDWTRVSPEWCDWFGRCHTRSWWLHALLLPRILKIFRQYVYKYFTILIFRQRTAHQ